MACVPLLAAAGAAACAKDEEPGIRFELLAPLNPAQRPESVTFYWLGGQGILVSDRLPAEGVFPPTGDVLGSLFIGTEQTLAEERALVVVGERGGSVVAGGSMRLPPTGERRRSLQVLLGAPLPDEDGDRIPNVVERNCLLAGAAMACPLAPDGGVPDRPDAGVDVSGDGPPAPDAAEADGAVDGSDDGPAEDGPDAPADVPADVTDVPSDLPPDGGNPALAVGLVAHWRFDDGSGTMARDSSNNGNLGMLLGTGTRWLPEGRVGGCLEIPATNGNGVTVPPTGSVETIGAGLTIAAWTFRTANKPGLSNVLSRRAAMTTSNEYFALAFNNNGLLRGFINTQLDPDPPSVTSTTAAALNRWVHVAVTFDGMVQRTFVDGIAGGTANYPGMVVSGSMPLCLGCGNNGAGVTDTDETLGGRLDELVLYNRALPLVEIQALARGELPPGQ